MSSDFRQTLCHPMYLNKYQIKDTKWQQVFAIIKSEMCAFLFNFLRDFTELASTQHRSPVSQSVGGTCDTDHYILVIAMPEIKCLLCNTFLAVT